MDFSLLQGIAGSEPGAGHATGAAQKAAPAASAFGAFRALVDVLANGSQPAGGEAVSSQNSDGAPQADAFVNLPDGNLTPVDFSDVASNSKTASVQTAFVAGWAVAPASTDEPENAGQAEAPHATGETPNDRRSDPSSGDENAPAETVVAAWLADILAPVAKAAGAAGLVPGDGQHDKTTGKDKPDVPAENRQLTTSTSADSQAVSRPDVLEDRISLSAAADAKAKETPAFDAILTTTTDAALKATASSAATSKSAPAESTTTTANTLSSFVKAGAPSRRTEMTTSASVIPTAVPHVVAYASSASFSTLMTGSSIGAPTSNSGALPDATATQIVQALRLTAMGSGGEAHIRLDPAQYGDLRVSVRVEQGQVVARLQADSPVVREWLQTNQGLLRNQLAEQNLTLTRLEISEPAESNSSSPDRRGTGHESASEGGRQPRRQRAPDSDERFEVVA